jgi:hypothetical protein
MNKRAILAVLLAWSLWYTDSKTQQQRIDEFSDLKECWEAARRINGEWERKKAADRIYLIYVGPVAWCYERIPMPWDVPPDKRYY